MSKTLIDSNLVIYSVRSEFGNLRQLVRDLAPQVSSISVIEVLGYHKMTPEDRSILRNVFRTLRVLKISNSVVEEAVRLRQLRRMKLGDSIIAATTIVHSLRLLTHNLNDFEWIPALSVEDPLA